MEQEAQHTFIEDNHTRESDLSFAMAHNGFEFNGRDWTFDPKILEYKASDLDGLRVSMFGPSPAVNPFFKAEGLEAALFSAAFFQGNVTDVIGKYRRTDEEQAGRIAFILGGILRKMSHPQRSGGITHQPFHPTEINDVVDFAAKMVKRGEHKSADAIAAAMALYVLDGGDIDDDLDFEGDIYRMTDAIREDPIIPRETADLGLSQVLRLRSFIDRQRLSKGEIHTKRPLPEISKDLSNWTDFPTVGAEFHFAYDAKHMHHRFLQRLALLNASMHQLGSSIQFCRNDRNVIEVRMNPSVFPVTVALWNHIRTILPEVNKAFFTMTYNRDDREDFRWSFGRDEQLLNKLKALGLLTYATVFKSEPEAGEPDEINFGTAYLGQTVKMVKGKFKYTGLWSPKEESHGQLGIYAGYGSNFPYLGYYPSMALADPNILRGIEPTLDNINTLHDALKLSPKHIRRLFRLVDSRIRENPRLRAASKSGARIVDQLTP